MIKILHVLHGGKFSSLAASAHHLFGLASPAWWVAAALVLFVLKGPGQGAFGTASRKASAFLFTVSGFFLIAAAFK